MTGVQRPDSGKRIGPRREVGADSKTKVTTTVATSMPPVADNGEQLQILARRSWARRLIDKARGADIPTYGDAVWLALPQDDALRIAAVVVAAESWARAGDELVVDLTREAEVRRLTEKREEDVAYQQRAAAHRQAAPRFARSFLDRRREQLAAVAPRPGDFQGRGEGA